MRHKRPGFTTIVSLVAALLVVCGAAAERPTANVQAVQDNHRTSGAANAVSTATDVAAEGDWPMAAANPQRTSWTPEEVRGLLKPIWHKPIEPYISQKVQIIASNDLLYISTARGLYALHTGTGATGEAGDVAWVYPTELPLGHSPTIHDGVAYVGGFDHRLHAIDALTGQGIWTFEAESGFQTNPLVVEGKVYAGNRDGYMYAIHAASQPGAGQLAWKYKTGGPILFSAAYQDNTLYFAANDSHAYALNATNGTLIWKSAKLPGGGFNSWWPVVHQDKVIFAGGHNYRVRLDPGPETDLQGLETSDLYEGVPTDQPIAASRVLAYYEQKPHRRTYFVLKRSDGQEVTYDFDGDGLKEYAPITWFGTHSPGNRYPPVVGSDGKLYQSMNYQKNSDSPIPRGNIVGWEPDTASYSTVFPPSLVYGMDEPMAYSAGGNVIYYNWLRDCRAGAIDYTTGTKWNYLTRCYELAGLIPGYDVLYYLSAGGFSEAVYRGAHESVNGLYGRHGDQNPPIPYKGKVYMHRSNAVIAWGNYTGNPTGLPMAAAVNADNGDVTPVSTDQLEQKLSYEVQKILEAGHLRPGWLSSGLFDQRAKTTVGENLVDYWHHPSDILYTLILALPHLPPDQQEAVKSYLQNEYANYPPHTYVHIGWKDGAAREIFDLPPEVENDLVNHPAHSNWASFYEGWHYPPHMFYALWKYAQVFGGAQEIFNNSKNRLQSPPPDSYLADYPYVHNAYIAGYLGYLELEKLATGSESATIRAELDRLLVLRTTTFDKDSPWFPADKHEYARALNVARNFMYLVPELGQYLRDNVLGEVEVAIDEYNYVAPYWFVTKTEHMFCEGTINPLFDYGALFQARAMILKEPREELLKYLDVPAFERGDLFYIQNLVATIEAPHCLEKTATAPFGYPGDPIAYTLHFSGGGSTLTLTDTLPLGVSAPGNFELAGTSVTPTYDNDQHRLTWSDTPPAGQEVTIRYAVTITTSSHQALVNTAELSEVGGALSTATTTVTANPHLTYLPLIRKDN